MGASAPEVSSQGDFNQRPLEDDSEDCHADIIRRGLQGCN